MSDSIPINSETTDADTHPKSVLEGHAPAAVINSEITGGGGHEKGVPKQGFDVEHEIKTHVDG